MKSCEEVSDELNGLVHSDDETLQKFLNGGKLEEPEKVAKLLDIGFVSHAIGADGTWTVSVGYRLKVRQAPFLLFINREEEKDVLFLTVTGKSLTGMISTTMSVFSCCDLDG